MGKIGLVMVEARKKSCLTQRQVASKAGISLRTLTNLETGAVKPGLVTLYKLSIVYDLDLGDVQRIALEDAVGISSLETRRPEGLRR